MAVSDKEECRVIFKYIAINDDELSLEEGQIVQVLSKSAEDKGWWKGELNGKVGVFPENFVKIITKMDSNVVQDQTPKPKKNNENFNVESDTADGPIGRFNLRLPFPPLNRPPLFVGKDPANKTENSDSKATPLQSSSTLLYKPSISRLTKPQVEKRTNDEGSTKKDSKNVKSSAKPSEPVKSDNDFDIVKRDSEKLQHPTAERVKAPKRRPPSTFLGKELDELANAEPIETPESTKPDEAVSLPKKDEEPKKKPDWLQELTMKQANRRSGFLAEGLSEQPPPVPSSALKPTSHKKEEVKPKKVEFVPPAKKLPESKNERVIRPVTMAPGSFNTSDPDQLSLSQRVSLLELRLSAIEQEYKEKQQNLLEKLKIERNARIELEKKIDQIQAVKK